MQVKSFRLTTGEEIIAYAEPVQVPQVLSAHAGVVHWKLSKIRQVQLTAAPGGGIGFALLPWIASNPDMDLNIPPNIIAFEIEPLKGIEDSYVAQTSTVKIAKAGDVPQGIQIAK